MCLDCNYSLFKNDKFDKNKGGKWRYISMLLFFLLFEPYQRITIIKSWIINKADIHISNKQKQYFIIRFSELLNSCWSISKNVTYRKVPQANPSRIPIANEGEEPVPNSSTINPMATPNGDAAEKINRDLNDAQYDNELWDNASPRLKDITLLWITRPVKILRIDEVSAVLRQDPQKLNAEIKLKSAKLIWTQNCRSERRAFLRVTSYSDLRWVFSMLYCLVSNLQWKIQTYSYKFFVILVKKVCVHRFRSVRSLQKKKIRV